MTQEELKAKQIAQFKQNHKNIEKQFAPIHKFLENIKNIGNIINEYSLQSNQNKKQKFQAYLNGVQEKMFELNDESKIFHYLLGEKRIYTQKVIECNINKDKENSNFFKEGIDVIIDPLISSLQAEMELKKNIPSLKENKVATVNSILPAIESKPIDTLVEVPPVIETPSTEKVITKNAQEKFQSIHPLLEGFKQIECPAKKEEIENYFMILSKEKNCLNEDVFMEEGEVLQFLKKNFAVFDSIPSGGYFNINILPKQKGILIYFLYCFYAKYDNKEQNNKRKYIQLLINNFSLFKNDKPNILLSNMGETKKPKKGLINIKDYVKK